MRRATRLESQGRAGIAVDGSGLASIQVRSRFDPAAIHECGSSSRNSLPKLERLPSVTRSVKKTPSAMGLFSPIGR